MAVTQLSSAFAYSLHLIINVNHALYSLKMTNQGQHYSNKM